MSVSSNTAPIMPLAIASLLNFNKTVNVIKFNKDPSVITLPRKPAVFKLFIPSIKSMLVYNFTNKKQPIKLVARPISSPIAKSILFIPIPSIKLLCSVVGG